jgi:hypothetical protein
VREVELTWTPRSPPPPARCAVGPDGHRLEGLGGPIGTRTADIDDGNVHAAEVGMGGLDFLADRDGVPAGGDEVREPMGGCSPGAHRGVKPLEGAGGDPCSGRQPESRTGRDGSLARLGWDHPCCPLCLVQLQPHLLIASLRGWTGPLTLRFLWSVVLLLAITDQPSVGRQLFISPNAVSTGWRETSPRSSFWTVWLEPDQARDLAVCT